MRNQSCRSRIRSLTEAEMVDHQLTRLPGIGQPAGFMLGIPSFIKLPRSTPDLPSLLAPKLASGR